MAVNESKDREEGAKGKKRSDHTEVEFEFGNIEFEAKGRSVVVERMFRLLLEKIESGSLVASFTLQDIDDEEEEEEEEEEVSFEDVDEYEELPDTELAEDIAEEEPSFDDVVEPPPSWDTLESEEPEVSDAEKEEFDLE